MTGFRVTLPFASWRVEFARQYRETHILPPPSTVYGFFLSLVGEGDPEAYRGAKCSVGFFKNNPGFSISTVLRKIRRINEKNPHDVTPDIQEIFSNVELALWLHDPKALEKRVHEAIRNPHKVTRFGALSLGESTNLVNDINVMEKPDPSITFLVDPKGKYSFTTRPDYNSNLNASYVTGDLFTIDSFPDPEKLPVI